MKRLMPFFRFLFRIYPPFLGAGIKVKLSKDLKCVDVEMGLHWWNRNYVGSHYGGSLYSMCDPFFMLLLLENLGPQYIIWDRKASIQFKKPGREKVKAHFFISEEKYDEIRRMAE